MVSLESFTDEMRVAIIGASGGIGRAFVEHLAASKKVLEIHALSRKPAMFESAKVTSHRLVITDEQQLSDMSKKLRDTGRFDLIICATGILHTQDFGPEKTMRAMNLDDMRQVFETNTFGPALVGKHFLPLLRRDAKSVFAALSARVGSVSDNHLGGWYSYRASKAALNMMMKTLAIENARKNKQAILLSLHPGTVNTALSEPFQGNVPDGKLFTPSYSAEKLLDVIDTATADQNGSLIAWDGQTIPF